MWAVENIPYRSNVHPSLTPLRKHRIQMTLKDLAGILEILLGVRLRGRYAFKSFVKDGDDAALLGEGWNNNGKFTKLIVL